MRITIDTQARTFALDVGVREPILSIKKKVQETTGLPSAAQILSVWGWELVDGLDMEDYPFISEGTKIDLTTKATQNSGRILVVVKFSARQISIEVDTSDTVRSLKEKIHIVENTPVKRMSLFFSGVELDDDFRNLSEYGVHDYAEVIVFLKSMTRVNDDPPARRVKIAVQTASCLLNSAVIPVEMKDSGTISELKQLLLGRNILPPDDYLFIHKQRIMREQCSLRWHGVETDDFVYVFKGTVTRSSSF